MTDTQPSIPDRGPKKSKPRSANLKPGRKERDTEKPILSAPRSAKPGRSIVPTIDHALIPPAAQLRLSSPRPLKKHTDHELHKKRNTRYQGEYRERQSHKRESSITGMVVKDPVSIVPLRLSEFEKKMVIEASSKTSLAKHSYDAKRILTPREDRDFYAALAREILVELLRERLRPKKKP